MISTYVKIMYWFPSIEALARNNWGNRIIDACLADQECIFGTDFDEKERMVIINCCAPELLVYKEFADIESLTYNSLVDEMRYNYHIPFWKMEEWSHYYGASITGQPRRYSPTLKSWRKLGTIKFHDNNNERFYTVNPDDEPRVKNFIMPRQDTQVLYNDHQTMKIYV